jgi:hypothetical protein
VSDFEIGTYDAVSDYITDARVLLQDNIAPYRYADSELLVALNTTILEARRLRPDLFVWVHGRHKVPSFSSNDSELVKIEPPFRLAFVYGIVAHALMRDQEDIEDQRASTFMSAFNTMLIGTGAAAIITPPGRGAGPPPQQG